MVVCRFQPRSKGIVSTWRDFFRCILKSLDDRNQKVVGSCCIMMTRDDGGIKVIGYWTGGKEIYTDD